MKNILQYILKIALMITCIICSANFARGQAKNSIGLGVGINTSREGAGFGAILQGEVKLTNSISITPSLGAEIPYVVHLGLGGRYYFSDEVYGGFGAFGHFGGDDGASAGLGGTAGIGFILLQTTRHVIDLNFHADLFENDHRRITLAGLRLIYNFSFSRLK